MHGHNVYVHVYVQEYLRTQDSLQYNYVHKESSVVWPDPFLAQGVYHLQYKPGHGTLYGRYAT